MTINNSRFIAKNGLDNNGNRITNVATPTIGTDAVNLNYIDANIPYLAQNETITGNWTFPTGITAPNVNLGSSTITSGSLSNITQTANIRQSVISGPINLSNGRPSFLEKSTTTGQVNIVNLSTDYPLTISYANGFGSQADTLSSLTSSVSNALSSANAGSAFQKYYIYADYVDSSTTTFNSTLVQPQYGSRYSTPSQARLRFAGTDDLVYSTGDGRTLLRDNYGNIWIKPAKANVSFTNTGFVGERSALFDDNPGGSLLDCSDVDNLGNGPWTIGFHIKYNGTVPVSGVHHIVTASTQATVTTTTGYGATLGFTFSAGGSAALTAWLSNTGTSNDIANAVQGTSSVINPNQWYYIALTYTGNAYYFGRGTSGGIMTWEKIGTSGLKICPITRMSFGSLVWVTATTGQFQIDDFYFMRYCKMTTLSGGVDLAANTTSVIEGDYFNIPSMKMYSLSGDGINMVNGVIASVNATTDTLVCDAYHNFAGGERVVFDNQAYAMSLPAGITANTVYYVIENSVLADGVSFQVASTSTSQTPVNITGTIAAGTSYTVSAPMERYWSYHKPYFNSLDNTIEFRDIPHGLDFDETFWFWSSTPGGLLSDGAGGYRYGYQAVPCSENKLRIASTLSGVSNVPVVMNSWSDSTTLNNSISTTGPKTICYGLGDSVGKFICFSNSSSNTVFYYSADGVKWTSSTLPAAKTWVDCTFDGTQFVILSSDGYTATSTNGVTWSALSSVIVSGTVSFTNIIYGGGAYIAYNSTNMTIYRSTNLTSWSAVYVLSSFSGQTILFEYALELDKFIALPKSLGAGVTNTFFYGSSAGATWTSGTMPSSQYWGTLTYGNGIFVAASNQTSALAVTTTAAYSTNGTSWTAMTLPVSGNWNVSDFYNGVFIIGSSSGNTVLSSTLGTGSWVNQGAATSTISVSSKAAGGNGVFVMTSSVANTANNISYNYSATWESNLTLATGANITYGKGIYVSNTSAGIVKSYNGVNWSQSLAAATASGGNSAYGSGMFVMLAGLTSSTSWSSVDGGDTWTARTMPASFIWKSIAYGNGKFLATDSTGFNGAIGTITQSTGAITWATATIPFAGRGCYFAPNPGSSTLPGVFFIVQGNTTLSYSKDLASWTNSTLPITSASHTTKVAAGGNGKVVVASSTSGSVMVASVSNIASWTTVTGVLAFTSPTTVAVVYRNGLFVATSAAGVSYSNDGLTWTSYSTGLPTALTSTAALTYPTIGNGNLILNIAGNTYLAQVGPNSLSNNITVTDSNFRTVTTLPSDNLVAKNRVYLGEINLGTATPYSYRGEYISDWFPVSLGTVYTKSHNIGTGLVTTDVFFNKYRSDTQCYEVDADAMITSAGTQMSFGCQTMTIDPISVVVVTGKSALDFRNDNSNFYFYTSSDFGYQTSGYYKIHVQRSW